MKFAYAAALLLGLSIAISIETVSGIHHNKLRGDAAVNTLQAGTPISTSDPSSNNYQAPNFANGDCRGPCPALNILANHGLLPRDGKGITHELLRRALIDVYGLSSALGSLSFGNFFVEKAFAKFANPATQTFSLCDLLLNIHSNDQPSKSAGIEHYASLTRSDRPDFTHNSDNTQRSPSPIQLAILLGASKDKKWINMDALVTARLALWAQTYRNIPSAHGDKLDGIQHIIAATEGCLLLGVLSGNGKTYGQFQFPYGWAESMLLHEQFPAGWKSELFGWPQLISCLTQQGVGWAKDQVSTMAGLGSTWFADHF